MLQQYYQKLHNTISPPERGTTGRVPLRHYVGVLKEKSKSKAISCIHEFLDEVFSAEGACRFFKTFLLRFLSDGNKSSGDDSLGTLAPAFALAWTYPIHRQK